jgi:DNA ligase (NAD+)
MLEMGKKLNADYRLADKLPQDQLKEILLQSDAAYDAGCPLLKDEVYDYVKRIYNQRDLKTGDKERVLLSVSSPSGVGLKRERDTPLPVVLRSLDNMFHSEGDVEKWVAKKAGTSFNLSAKMDGISGLYGKGVLYTRGDATTGRNLSHLVPLLKTRFPEVPYYVRGELVMDKAVFKAKFQGQKGRGNTRNSVSGALGAIHQIDKEFLGEIEFIAYEMIPFNSTESVCCPSEQFSLLEKAGFIVAARCQTERISDTSLADYYQRLLTEYRFDIDGVVVARDEPYIRTGDKNPLYARAFKQALECLIAPSRILSVEWNVSSYGYLIPTILYEPVQICGVTLARATGESARYILTHGIGPGAEVEIIYHGKVNPRIHLVVTPVEPSLPPVGEWEWIPRAEYGEPIHIRAIGETNTAQIEIKGLTRFLAGMNIKNVGEGLVTRLHTAGFNTIEKLLTMRPADIAFMGRKTSESIPASIKVALAEASPVTLMTCSGVFGRGLGEKKLVKLFQQYPDFLTGNYTIADIEKVDGFAGKTAGGIVQNMRAFQSFLDQHSITVTPPVASVPSTTVSTQQLMAPSQFTGKSICLTGFRNEVISNFLTAVNGKQQNTCNKSTAVLIIPDAGYTNKKTEFALENGIPILTADEFIKKYGLH